MGRDSGEARRVLLVEDDAAHALLMRERLKELAREVEHARTLASAKTALSEQVFDAVVLDVGLPDGSGRELHQWLIKRRRCPPIVYVTSDDLAENAVAAIQDGAVNYVVKRPQYLDRMMEAILGVLARRDEGSPLDRLPSGVEGILIGDDPAMVRVRGAIQETGRSGAIVLISGETGTGKDLAARAVHNASMRADHPFVAVNCAAVAESLFESEFFGSIRGAFTGSVGDRRGLVGEACAGTLFLDEVAELSQQAQAKLLRLLDSGTYRPVGGTRELRADVRLIAATNRNLREAVSSGGFRQDLYYRLDVLRVHMPALRDRRGDIPMLIHHFARLISGEATPPRVAPGAMAALMAHDWPGNVRELRHVIERTLAVRQRGSFTIEHFALDLAKRLDSGSVRASVDGVELVSLLVRHAGRVTDVAAEAGVSVRTIQRRMRDLHLRIADFRRPD
jgi:DNA-binding NtrC family response regulator